MNVQATYIGEMLTADFEENTITFLIDSDNFTVKAGKYYIFLETDLQKFATDILKK
jgi:hypothetical protein